MTRDNAPKLLEFLEQSNPAYERMLFNDHYSRLRAIFSGENPPPYEVEIQSTAYCNAGCKHCWGARVLKSEDKLNTREAMNRVVNQILGFRQRYDGVEFEVDSIKFCGSTGEPLLNPFTLNAIEGFQGLKPIRLFTNGILLGEHKEDRVYLSKLESVRGINISLDAAKTETLHRIKPGSKQVRVEDILEAAFRLRIRGVKIDLSYVITQDNYEELAEFAQRAREFSAADSIRYRIDLTDREVSEKNGARINELIKRAISFENRELKIVPMHSQEEIKEKDQERFSSRGCGLRCYTSRLWACVGSNGRVYPCGHIVAGDTEDYGDLLTQRFPEIWTGEKRKQLIEKLPSEKCTICSPFSLRANEFMSFLSGLELEEIDSLHREHILKPEENARAVAQVA